MNMKCAICFHNDEKMVNDLLQVNTDVIPLQGFT